MEDDSNSGSYQKTSNSVSSSSENSLKTSVVSESDYDKSSQKNDENDKSCRKCKTIQVEFLEDQM